MEHDIYIYPEGKSKSSGIRIPWLPNEIEVNMGELRALEYDILDQGPVDIPCGSELGEIKFASVFPGKVRKGLPFLRGSLKKPDDYIKQINSWKTKGTKLKCIITGTKINHKVFIQNCSYKYSGGYGDISYELTLKTRRELKITTIKKKKKKKNKSKSGTKKSPSTYTVKKGDTLWAIAGKYLGKSTRWKEIYTLNKSVIESTAKRYGKKSSNGGWWIYPGTKLKLKKR